MWIGPVLLYGAAALAAHAVVVRLPLPGNSVAKFVAVGATFGAALGIHLYLLRGIAIDTWAALIAYALVCELYLFLFTFVMSSVSVGLLLALWAGPLLEQDVDERHSMQAMVRDRIKRLVSNGFLAEDAIGLVPTSRALRLLRAFGVLRSIFHHASSQEQLAPHSYDPAQNR